VPDITTTLNWCSIESAGAMIPPMILGCANDLEPFENPVEIN
jgi:hypothetical protein